MGIKKREMSFELLRIISMLFVIILHVETYYIEEVNKLWRDSDILLFSKSLFETITRIAVPCFLMITGAFVLNNHENRNYIEFYRRSFKKLFIHAFIIGGLYFFYAELRGLALFFLNGETEYLFKPFINLLKGAPFYHLWYMTLLIGVYLFIPWIIRLKEQIGEKGFLIISILMIIVSMFSDYTSRHALSWDLGKVILYVPFLNLGYIIYNKFNQDKKINVIIFSLCMYIFINITNFFAIRYVFINYDSADFFWKVVTSYFSLFTILSSLLIFTFFANINIKIRVGNISENSYYVYLFHAGVLDIILLLLKKLEFDLFHPILEIIFIAVVTYFISDILGKIYQRCFTMVIKKIQKQSV